MIERETRFELAKWLVNRGKMAKYNLGSSGIPGRVLGRFQPPRDVYVSDAVFDGDEELRCMIAEKYRVGLSNVVLTASASEANFLVYYVFLRNGGTVLVEKPSYEPLMRLGEFLGAKVIWLDRKFESGYAIDLEYLKEKIKGVQLLVLTNLHNPSGVSIPSSIMRGVLEIAEDADTHVLCDEVFKGFAPKTKSAVSLGENCTVTCSLSKFYGFGGLRLGWAVSSENIVKKIQLVREMGSVCCSRLDEHVAKRVLNDRELIQEALSISRNNKKIVKKWIQREKRVKWVEPDGGIICFPRVDTVQDTCMFAEFLFDRYGTLVSPGEYFGEKGHIRICYSASPDIVEKGLQTISDALDHYEN